MEIRGGAHVGPWLATQASSPPPSSAERLAPAGEGTDGELRKAFTSFVGQTFYGQLLSAMRKTVGEPAYFHGGRGEEVFRAQLDQVLAERMSEATAESFAGPMFELFQLPRPG